MYTYTQRYLAQNFARGDSPYSITLGTKKSDLRQVFSLISGGKFALSGGWG